jgi:hypothetical protein
MKIVAELERKRIKMSVNFNHNFEFYYITRYQIFLTGSEKNCNRLLHMTNTEACYSVYSK